MEAAATRARYISFKCYSRVATTADRAVYSILHQTSSNHSRYSPRPCRGADIGLSHNRLWWAAAPYASVPSGARGLYSLAGQRWQETVTQHNNIHTACVIFVYTLCDETGPPEAGMLEPYRTFHPLQKRQTTKIVLICILCYIVILHTPQTTELKSDGASIIGWFFTSSGSTFPNLFKPILTGPLIMPRTVQGDRFWGATIHGVTALPVCDHKPANLEENTKWY